MVSSERVVSGCVMSNFSSPLIFFGVISIWNLYRPSAVAGRLVVLVRVFAHWHIFIADSGS